MTDFLVKMRAAGELIPWIVDLDYADLLSAVAASVGKTLIITKEHTLTGDMSFPETMAVQMFPGSKIKTAFEEDGVITECVLTINCAFDAGMSYVFDTALGGSVAFGVNSVNRIFPQWFGADATGTTDSTRAFAAAISALPSVGGTVATTPGTYLFDNIELPPSPKVITIEMGGAIYQPFSSNTRLFTAGTNDVARFNLHSGRIKAHALGSMSEAILMKNMRGACISNLGWESNDGGNFAQGVVLIASTYGCYGNVLDRFWAYGQSGPTTLVDFQNEDDSAANANANTIKNFFIQGNTISAVINGVRSAKVEVSGCCIQGNSGTAIIPGTEWNIHDNWFEQNGLDIDAQTVVGGESNAVHFHDNFIGSGHTITIDGNLRSWNIANNEPAVNLTVVDTSAYTYNIIQRGSISEFSNIHARLVWHNVAAGGGNWAWLITATGGPFPGTLALMDVDNEKYPLQIASNCDADLLNLSSVGVTIYNKDVIMNKINKGIVMSSVGGTMRVRLNDTADGLVYEPYVP